MSEFEGPEEPEDEEAHEVEASYDNMMALALGLSRSCPCLSCSCGFVVASETWERAGAIYDEHLQIARGSDQ